MLAANALPDPLPWLLDPADPGPRYLALRDVVGLPADDPELLAARAAAHAAPPIAPILDAMQPDGYWEKPGPGYGPKYRSTVWALITLGQVGASAAADERIGRAAAYLLDHTYRSAGQLSAWGGVGGSATADCLQGNLLAALLDVGQGDPRLADDPRIVDDPRLDGAFEWMARTVTGEGMAPATDKHAPRRYYASSKSGPLFECAINDHQACAWGGAKVMVAFSKLPAGRRTPLIDEAIRQGAEYLLSIDPATGGYPHPYAAKPSGNWWKFGFPVFYVADLLQIVEALAALGYGDDPRLANARALIAAKADADGRWPLEYHYNGKIWDGVEFGRKGQANKWVTIRALKIIRN